ncbi:MAG: cob(I)yrinic acid a,c-diamide adenosyltransferase [Bacteroidota bacterium]|nr:cob(I)yrinic acid a,c-diamide adenosyltransferase [Bacteroidota bacterium]
MKIYTKTGDKGETSLVGGERVTKDSLRIEAYGTVDELNSFIGLAITELTDNDLVESLQTIQHQLFDMGSDLACPFSEKTEKYNIPRIEDAQVKKAELEIDKYSLRVEELRNFILPGGSKGAALLHVCRTVCRRAERRVIAAGKAEQINKNIVILLNRFSDLFFVMARYENKVSGKADINWKNTKI